VVWFAAQVVEQTCQALAYLHKRGVALGLYPIVTFQYSSTTSYQVSYHIQYMFV
jgi:hypothetical protein